MRASTVLSLMAAAGGALAQVNVPSSIFGTTISPQCQQTILTLLTNSTLAQCLHSADLLPLLSTTGSAIPILDNFMSDLCYDGNDVCSNATLNAAIQTVATGCPTEVGSNPAILQIVTYGFEAYPLVREILCTKTEDPYTNASYGGFLGEPPIPISASSFNSTDGFFCVTSLLTQLSAYFQTNLTIPFAVGLFSGQNATALDLGKMININFICNECVFATFDLIEAEYPAIANITFGDVINYFNLTIPFFPLANYTLNSLADGECQYNNQVVTENGTLPTNISVSIVNSTFPVTIVNGATSGEPSTSAA